MTSGEALSNPPKLSAIQRLKLIRTLNGLPGPQFGELAFSLNPPPGIIPPDIAAQGNRTSVLLQWAEGTGGPGLAVVQELLNEILGEPNPVASNSPNNGPLFLAPRRNPFFTGREDVLAQIHQAMAAGEPAALSGLGGVGKTQTAAEYAHRYRGQYNAVLWVRAETVDELMSGLTALAQDLGLALSQEADQAVVVQAVRGWLSKNTGWLLVLDNADHLELVRDWLALCDRGHILLTTRASETRPLAVCVPVLKMPPQEGALFLLRRSGRVGKEGAWEEATEADQALVLALCAQMDGLPLALDQAGAYILETPSNLKEYLRLYETAGPQLLAQRGDNALDHSSVTITFGLAVQVASQRLPAVAALLNLCAFLAPDGIPEEVFKDGAAFEEPLQSALAEPLEYMALLREAGRFSLVVRDVEEQTFSVHRLVQEVIRDGLDEAAQESLIRQLLEAMNGGFPDPEFANWLVCDRLLPHALALVGWQQRFAIETESTGRLLHQIASYLDDRGRYSEAKPLLQGALTMRKRLLGNEHADVATSLNNLALLYDNQGRYSEAEPLYQDALAMRKRLLGDEHPDVAQSLSNLALLYDNQGRYSEAEPLLQDALAMRKRLLGDEHPDVATSLNNLALLYDNQGRYSEAEPLLQDALAMKKRLLGDEHPAVARSLNNLASLYKNQGRYSEAEPLLQDALAMYKRLLGDEHPAVARSLNNLASLYKNQGRYSEAEPLYQDALAMYKRLLDDEHPDIARSLNNLAGLYKNQGRYSEAKPLYQDALAMYKRLLGDEHPAVALSLNNLAGLYDNQGRYGEAEPLYQDALAMFKRLLGNEHPYTKTVQRNLGRLQQRQSS
ncbi:tetratricopeptide repeat protein [Nodosilinea sp. LEGE 07298]|uniref:FxSxx-COOH system tetratricopeptide repeat protein n=1 Tax=Nodosilinea sp. LEGE 07298 TaxID=2777970 RepID=UPI001880A059|nr:FxSxx-COOH system tetratricopeptide repeat protein [Nodosilinea sp. LEGE 07298]MBE9110361.1 tetratricopeptide repeat protein [Nodosilinea sp. LEGE 07298]